MAYFRFQPTAKHTQSSKKGSGLYIQKFLFIYPEPFLFLLSTKKHHEVLKSRKIYNLNFWMEIQSFVRIATGHRIICVIAETTKQWSQQLLVSNLSHMCFLLLHVWYVHKMLQKAGNFLLKKRFFLKAMEMVTHPGRWCPICLSAKNKLRVKCSRQRINSDGKTYKNRTASRGL